MAQVDWRVWLYDQLRLWDPFTAIIPADSIYGGGSLKGAPNDKPFAVISLDPELPGPFKGVSYQDCTIRLHDEPGDYMRIGDALREAKAAIDGANPKVAGLIGCVWQGDSADLADDFYGTIFRSTSYRLAGRK